MDLFAGGGGASEGIKWALGRGPDVAVNHDAAAVSLHERNHPDTIHYRSDVLEVAPRCAVCGRRVGLLWASPDCRHFSRAKGAAPVSKRVRALAWVVVRWARDVGPRVIVLENVAEFRDWGPLDADDRPIPERKGETFRKWVAALRAFGYAVEWRLLSACDYGAPTMRKRLFVVARRDGLPIAWPAPTHGPSLLAYRTAAECIDWSLPCPSIFLTRAQAKSLGFDVNRPLAEKTLRRIARGVWKHVLLAEKPFLVRGAGGVVGPTLVQVGYGEREGQAPRVPDLHRPLGTVVSGGEKFAVAAALLVKHYGGHEGSGKQLDLPMDTVTAIDHHALVEVGLTGGREEESAAFLTAYYGTDQNLRLDLPLPTVTTKDRFNLVMVDGVAHEVADIGMRMLEPRELYRAQGFPEDYVIATDVDGKPMTRKTMVRLAGNSVPPHFAAALVRANFAMEMEAAA